MSVPRLLFLLLLLVPAVEIYLLIQVGSVIGALPTLGLVVATAVLGVYVLRTQGLTLVRRMQQLAQQGEPPSLAMLEGMVLLVSGVLLLLPGFFTDALGLLGLLSPLRHALVRRFLRKSVIFHAAAGNGPAGDQPPRRAGPATLEGEYTREDE